MKQRILNSETLRGLWETHLFACSWLVFLLMMLADGVGYLITFGQRSGGELVDSLGQTPNGGDDEQPG